MYYVIHPRKNNLTSIFLHGLWYFLIDKTCSNKTHAVDINNNNEKVEKNIN